MKSTARLYAVQALFQMEAAGQGVDRVRLEFLNHRFGAVYEGEEMADGDSNLFQRLLDDAVMWQGKIDQATDRALVAAWPIDRIDPVLRALFRAAGAELSTPATPPKVVINEFVDVARAFFPEAKSRNSSMRCLITWRGRSAPRRFDQRLSRIRHGKTGGFAPPFFMAPATNCRSDAANAQKRFASVIPALHSL